MIKEKGKAEMGLLRKIIAGILIMAGSTYIVFLIMGFSSPYPFMHTTYSNWVFDVLRGDFGLFYGTGQPVSEVIGAPVARTFLLNFTALFVSLFISIPLGIFSATRKSIFSKHAVMFISAVATAVPAYIIGLFILYNLSVHMPFLPVSGMRSLIFRVRGYENIWHEIGDIARHMILPVFSMSVVITGTFVPYIRNSLIEVLREDYIRTAKAKGMGSYKILFRHALKNAILPLISLTAMMLPGLIMSNIFVETVFRWPGIGLMFIESLYTGEINLIASIVLFYSALTVAGSIVSDIISRKMDPRTGEDFAP